MKHFVALISGLFFAATSAAAQEAVWCDWQARADGIVEPWEDHTRTFANGNVRLALLDTVEPANGAFHILVISPPHNELGERQCMTVGERESYGFNGVDWPTLTADYQPSVGLIFTVNIERYNGEDFRTLLLRFTVNQATGEITARYE